MRLIRGAALLLAATLAVTAEEPPIVRPSPEFKVRFVDGSQAALSSFRGKVVALLFVHTTCPHCQHASEVFSRLYTEYGSRGFQPIDVAFNSMANLYVRDFVKDHNINYPVGFDTPENVMNYLGFSIMEYYVVPQIVWIDRKGNIRSQTPPRGEDKLLQEAYWRSMIETLTKEPMEGPKTTTHRTTTTAKKGS
ncbi:MAG TPA: TlpA disulfide reductase family protein [Bryobacteraceae bacterium]|nr:TlpA disulfide reductase family protein [Bryobacteraceae bacterium]